ncbi:MAG: hypothetical protein WDN06_14960 [Asticcacaulis sp.]
MSNTPAPHRRRGLVVPAHMTTGDSFGRPADETRDVGDGISIGARRGGPRPPKKPGIRPSSWLWLTLWGVTGDRHRRDSGAQGHRRRGDASLAERPGRRRQAQVRHAVA